MLIPLYIPCAHILPSGIYFIFLQPFSKPSKIITMNTETKAWVQLIIKIVTALLTIASGYVGGAATATAASYLGAY